MSPEFIDLYAGLDKKDVIRYREEYLPKSQHKEELMGFTQMMIDEGRKKGRKEGEVLMLRRQLSRRFGTVPVWAEDRLKQAEQKDLEIWIDRILDAGSVEEVFKF